MVCLFGGFIGLTAVGDSIGVFRFEDVCVPWTWKRIVDRMPLLLPRSVFTFSAENVTAIFFSSRNFSDLYSLKFGDICLAWIHWEGFSAGIHRCSVGQFSSHMTFYLLLTSDRWQDAPATGWDFATRCRPLDLAILSTMLEHGERERVMFLRKPLLTD